MRYISGKDLNDFTTKHRNRKLKEKLSVASNILKAHNSYDGDGKRTEVKTLMSATGDKVAMKDTTIDVPS